jgi:hypothetical protein
MAGRFQLGGRIEPSHWQQFVFGSQQGILTIRDYNIVNFYFATLRDGLTSLVGDRSAVELLPFIEEPSMFDRVTLTYPAMMARNAVYYSGRWAGETVQDATVVYQLDPTLLRGREGVTVLRQSARLLTRGAMTVSRSVLDTATAIADEEKRQAQGTLNALRELQTRPDDCGFFSCTQDQRDTWNRITDAIRAYHSTVTIEPVDAPVDLTTQDSSHLPKAILGFDDTLIDRVERQIDDILKSYKGRSGKWNEINAAYTEQIVQSVVSITDEYVRKHINDKRFQQIILGR